MEPATEPKAVIVGTGRSGTGFIAAMLNDLGVRCGHEGWWNPLGQRESGLLVDSSWCAVPHLASFDGPVFHVVRHPLDVVSSLTLSPDWGPYADLRGVPDGYDSLRGAMWTVATWGRMCDDYDGFPSFGPYRVEDEDEVVDLLHTVGRHVGLPVTVAAARSAQRAGGGAEVNRHNVTGTRFGWGMLRACDPDLTDSLTHLTKTWGYDL